MTEPGNVWLMLAFPGHDTGRFALRAFAPAKNGKSWYRRFANRDAAIRSKRELVADGIPYKCIKVEARETPGGMRKLPNRQLNGVKQPKKIRNHPWRPIESRALRTARNADFVRYRHEMAPPRLPTPGGDASTGAALSLTLTTPASRAGGRRTYDQIFA